MAQQLNQYDNVAQELGFNIVAGSGAPTFVAKKGTIYVNKSATTTTTRLYVNTDGGTTWAYITTSA